MNEEEPLITIPLSHFVKLFLNGEYSRPIPHSIAEIVEAKSKGTTICYVQRRDKYNPSLSTPILWNWGKWRESIDNWESSKKRSEDERVMKFIFDENVKRVSKQCQKFLLMDEDYALPTAFFLMKHGRFVAMRAIGVNNLVKTIEECA